MIHLVDLWNSWTWKHNLCTIYIFLYFRGFWHYEPVSRSGPLGPTAGSAMTKYVPCNFERWGPASDSSSTLELTAVLPQAIVLRSNLPPSFEKKNREFPRELDPQPIDGVSLELISWTTGRTVVCLSNRTWRLNQPVAEKLVMIHAHNVRAFAKNT